MKQWLSIVLAASLLLSPFAAFGQDYGSQSSQEHQAPPVAQSLVREGDFAIKLAAELDLGNPANETEAEDLLAKADISPLNGWLSDYPMTPEIIGQLRDSIAMSASAGKLPMTAEEATRGLSYLSVQMNLSTPAGPGPGPGTAPEGRSSPAVVNNYYYNEGPPIITYYPPPPDYVYLYDWVPYPSFWFGFWFPGFFICHNFTTTVFVTNTVFVSRRAIVTNRFVDRDTRTVVTVDPVVRTREGSVRPVTALRTGRGEMFRTVTDMRHGVGMSGVSAVQRVSGNAMPGTGGFRSLEARRGAQSIYSRSVQNIGVRRGSQEGAGSSYRGQTNRGMYSRRSISPPDQRPYYRVAPGGTTRSYRDPSRSYTPVMRDNGGTYGRRSVSPVAPQRPSGGGAGREGNGSSNWYSGNGMRGNGRW